MSTTKTRPAQLRRIAGVTDRTAHPLWSFETNKHAVLVGPIVGSVELADGTVYDVSAPIIECETAEHAAEVAHHVALRYEDEGHPDHAPTADDPHPEPFVHLCTPTMCGEHKRPDSHPMQAMALARAERHMRGVAEYDPVHAHQVGQALGLIDPSTPPPAAMTRASVTAENAALNGLDGTGSTNVIPDVSLHVGDPGTTGASENANTGSYARQACSWNAAASGSKTNSSTLAYSTAGSVADTHFGTWSSATYAAGNYAIGGALASSVTAASITIAAGGLTLGAT